MQQVRVRTRTRTPAAPQGGTRVRVRTALAAADLGKVDPAWLDGERFARDNPDARYGRDTWPNGSGVFAHVKGRRYEVGRMVPHGPDAYRVWRKRGPMRYEYFGLADSHAEGWEWLF